MRSKKFFYNVITDFMLQIIIIIYGFILPKIIIECYGSSVNGLISSITQFLGYITLLESGFGPVVKSILYKPISSKNIEEIKKILKSSEIFFRRISYIFIIYIIVLGFLYPLIVITDFNYLYTLTLIIIISISIFAEYYFGMTYRLFLQANQKTYIVTIIQLITYIFSILAILIMAKFNISVHVIKLITGLIFVMRPLFQNIYVKKKYNIDLKNVSNDYRIKQKWDGLSQHIAYTIHTNTDITILTLFSTLKEVSVYSVYLLVVKGVKQFIQIFVSGIDAVFGNMIANDEMDNLREKFSIYEMVYYTLITIIFTCTIILIVPFVKIYTINISDVNYVRYLFGVLIVISEYIWAIRLPYSMLVSAAGHFKETRKGAWVEALSNIIISIILVIKFGIIGVTIGTIVSIFIRTIEFVYHANKFILKRNVIRSLFSIFVVAIETIIIYYAVNKLNLFDYTSYLTWCINAIIILLVSTLLTIILNIIFYRKKYFAVFKNVKYFLLKRQK